MKLKTFVPLIILILILVAGAIVALLLMNNFQKEQSDEITQELMDEFSRIRYFIVDWYDELSSTSDCQTFLNELRFEGGKYTLTTAKDRIRAVYPRGERFLKLEQVTKVEFLEVTGTLRCRLSYGKSGEYMFKVN